MIGLAGEQVIDLEGLAHHKGSVFGALGQDDQPTNEQFENNIGQVWRRFDPSRPTWLEDESRMIGKVSLPEPVLNQLNSGILVRFEIPLEARIQRLVSEYAGFSGESLVASINKLEERLGGARLKEAVTAIRSGDFHHAVGIVLQYYDKAYDFAINRRIGMKIINIPVHSKPPQEFVKEIIRTVRKFVSDENHLS
jgi:tRNA 2-selenouridine synthase